jgi:hypothetical protein
MYNKQTGGQNAISVGDSDIIDAIKKALFDSFQKNYPNVKDYQDIYIRSVRKPIQSKNACYWVTTDCRYCLNVGREHNSSTIYFRIDYRGIVMRCFSKKTTLSDRNIMCSKYHSIIHDISLKYKEILFPKLYSAQTQLQQSVYKLKQPKRNDSLNESPKQKQSSLDDFLDGDDHDLFS